jgi:hypothetical protein
VTSSASITLNAQPYPQVPCAAGFSPPPGNTGCNNPGGFGPVPLWGDSLLATCTANESGVSGSSTFSNSFYSTATDSDGAPLPSATFPVPTNPAVNEVHSGVITNVGDIFTAVLNQQIVHPDGSLTVNAVHMYLFGPTAVGEIVRGSVTCGTSPTSATSSDTLAPTCGTLVVEPKGPDDPTPRSPRRERIGVFDAGTGAAPTGLQSITNIVANNATVEKGAPGSGFAYLQFTPGMVGPLPMTATRINESLPMTWAFDATDVAGHVTHCGNSVGAGDDNYTTPPDAAVTVAAPGVLANDTDITPGATLTAGSASTPAHGTVVLNADGSFTYTPSNGYGGPDAFTYVVSDNTGASSTGTVNITAVSTAPSTFSVNDATVAEGDSGTRYVIFTVTRMGSSTGTASVNVANTNGTATVVGNDYTAVAPQTLTFDPGQTTKSVYPLIKSDTVPEADETFNLALSRPVGGTVADAKGIATITNDDVVPTLSVSAVSVNEGDAGATTPATFTITRSGNVSGYSTVKYKTMNGTATTVNQDYTALATKVVTFAPGDITKSVAATVKGDVNYEADETFKLVLSAPTIATIETIDAGTGVATIVNDDAQPLLSLNDVTAPEGSGGPGATSFVFTIHRSVNTAGTTAVKWKTAAGTALSSDFVAVPNTLVTFASGVSDIQVTVQVNGDTTFEPNETFSVVLSAPTLGAAISDGTGLGTIYNDD